MLQPVVQEGESPEEIAGVEKEALAVECHHTREEFAQAKNIPLARELAINQCHTSSPPR